MSHNAEKWRKILSDFQDAWAEHDGSVFYLSALTWLERRGTADTEGKPWAQFGEVIGNVPLDEENGYAIMALGPHEGLSPLAELHRQMIAAGLPIDVRHNEARDRFLELARIAGAALPRSIRDAIPCAPANTDSWWLATMWWSKPPSPEELNERGYRAIWSSPFLDAIETIERCNLTSENPSLRGDEGIADKSPHVTVKTLSKPPNKPSVELLVDVPPLRATLRTAEGEKLFDLPSEGVARWLKVLAEHPDEWIRPADYKTHGGDELDGVKPSDQLRSLKTMCPKLAKLIEPSKHNGMRFNPAPVAK